MTPAPLKACPGCGTLAATDDLACLRCGHQYRTRFHGTQALPAAPFPSMPAPPVPGPATFVANPPPVPGAPVTWAGASPPLGWSADYRKGVRRGVWIAPLAIGFFIFMALYVTAIFVATVARAKRTMPHRPATSRPAMTWGKSYTEP